MAPNIAAQSVTLKPVDESARGFLFSVYASTRAEELAVTGWTDQQKHDFLQMQFFAQDKHYRENYPGAEFEIIQVSSEPAGRLYVHDRPEEIRIIDISLLPQFRNHGIGTQLLQEILGQARKSGKTVSIHVEMFNPALRLYERLGFQKTGENGPYQLMRWSPEPGEHR